MKGIICDRCGRVCQAPKTNKEAEEIKVIRRMDNKTKVNGFSTRQLDFCSNCRSGLLAWLDNYIEDKE